MSTPAAETSAPFDPGAYARLFDASEDAVAVFLRDLRIAYANPAFTSILTVRPGETLSDRLGPLADVYDAPVLRVAQGGTPMRAIHHVPSSAGGRILLGSYTPVRDAAGGTAAVLFTAHDLPGWSEVEDSEEATSGLAVFDANLMLQRCNDTLRRLSSAALSPGMPLAEVLAAATGAPPDDPGKVRAILRHLRKRGSRPFDFHADNRRKLQFSMHSTTDGEHILRVADVTRTRMMQARADRQTALLRLLGETAETAGGNSAQAFPRFLDGLVRLAGCHAGMIAELAPMAKGAEPRLVPVAASGPWNAPPPPMPPLLRRALTERRAVRDDVPDDAPGLGHSLVLPVAARGRILGVIALSDRPARFDDALVATLEMALSTAAALFSLHTAERHRRQTTRDLRASQERVRTIFDNIQEGVVIAAENGAIIGFNAAAEHLFDHTLESVLGRNAALLAVADGEGPSPFTTETQGGRREILAAKKDGQTFPAEISVSRLVSEKDDLYIAIVQDISERKRIARIQSELVSTVGHDLRTPLTSILGALRLVNGGSLPPDREKDLLAIAERNGRRLMRLITDLLDLERINAGMIAFNPGPTDLGMVLRQSIESHRLLSEAKNLSIAWSLPPGPLWVHGDADRLSQIAVNIFGNAVRFSPQGGVIAIRAHDENGFIRIEFSDQGPGIPEEFLPVMFDRFQQVANRIRKAGSDPTEGSGLGLSIVRALISLHGGRVGAVSKPGEGATVFFELPSETPEV